MTSNTAPPPPPPAPPLLPYADLPAQYGIVCAEGPGTLKVTIPVTAGEVLRRLPTQVDHAGTVEPGGRQHGIRHLFAPSVIEVTAMHVSFYHVRVLGRLVTVHRPRELVYAARYVAHSGYLVVRAHHHQMIECRPIDDAKVLEWIAAKLRVALGFEDRP